MYNQADQLAKFINILIKLKSEIYSYYLLVKCSTQCCNPGVLSDYTNQPLCSINNFIRRKLPRYEEYTRILKFWDHLISLHLLHLMCRFVSHWQICSWNSFKSFVSSPGRVNKINRVSKLSSISVRALCWSPITPGHWALAHHVIPW